MWARSVNVPPRTITSTIVNRQCELGIYPHPTITQILSHIPHHPMTGEIVVHDELLLTIQLPSRGIQQTKQGGHERSGLLGTAPVHQDETEVVGEHQDIGTKQIERDLLSEWAEGKLIVPNIPQTTRRHRHLQDRVWLLTSLEVCKSSPVAPLNPVYFDFECITCSTWVIQLEFIHSLGRLSTTQFLTLSIIRFSYIVSFEPSSKST